MLNFLLAKGLMNGGKLSKIAMGIMAVSMFLSFAAFGAYLAYVFGVFMPKYNEVGAEIESAHEEMAIKREEHAGLVTEAKDRIAEIQSELSEFDSTRESIAAEVYSIMDSIDTKRAENESRRDSGVE
jgi:hypothetical protein